MTILGLEGDPPGDFSYVQNFRFLGVVEAYNFYNGIVREGGSLGGS